MDGKKRKKDPGECESISVVKCKFWAQVLCISEGSCHSIGDPYISIKVPLQLES